MPKQLPPEVGGPHRLPYGEQEMRGRATPFGLFAGVAPLRFGQEPSAHWSGSHQVQVKADAVWLAGVIERLESCPALRRRLTVMVNDLAFVRGGRLVVPWQPHAGKPDRRPLAEVSVRHSKAVQTVMRGARSSIRVSDLLDKLATEIPRAAVAAVDVMLAELVARGFLITSLRPRSTSTDGLAYVLDQLEAVQAGTVEEVASLVEELRGIQAQIDVANRSASWFDGRARRVAAEQMRTVSGGVDQPLRVDLRLGCTVVLPPQVAAEAEKAAGALLLLSPSPAGHPALRDYHTNFLDRFGVGALIPVDQLVDPVSGLGFPSHYCQPNQPTIPAEISQRDQRLLALAQQAALDGVREVVLDETVLDELAEGSAGMRPAAHGELCAEIHAPTMAALAEGTFTLVVAGVGRTALAMTGRFLDLLPDGDRERMISEYSQLPLAVDGALRAQLSFPPKYPRMENIACALQVLAELICLAEHRDGVQGRIPVQDLAVTADDERLYVVSLSRRQVVEPLLANAAALHAMPPIARLMFELPRARSAVLAPFVWGAGACLPFLPRVRYGRSVLAPARWRMLTRQLPGPDAPWPTWRSAMTALRERLRLPTSVEVGTADRRLRLHLGEPMDLALLRAHFDHAGEAAVVWEAPTASDYGWFAGRAHEIVIPLASTTPAVPAPAVVSSTGALSPIGRGPTVLPGSSVLYAKVYGHLEVFDTILATHVPALLSAWEDPPLWWFIRYRDPAPHLRLRLHLASHRNYGQAAARVGAWAAGLRRRGLIGDLTLDTYHPETARYGSGAAMRAAEAVFAADSAAVLAQLTVLGAAREMHPHALTAVSLVDLTVAFAVAAVPTGQYQRALQVLDTAITKLVRTRLDAASARMAAALRPSLAEFDLVRGLTGLGAYLLRRDPQGELLRQVLAYLVRLTEPLPADDHLGVSAPGWWTSDLPSGQANDAFRDGHADLGMAHGIAGPLALLALALRQGITVEGQTAAIERKRYHPPAARRTGSGHVPVRSAPARPHHRPCPLPRMGRRARDRLARRYGCPFLRYRRVPAAAARHAASPRRT